MGYSLDEGSCDILIMSKVKTICNFHFLKLITIDIELYSEDHSCDSKKRYFVDC